MSDSSATKQGATVGGDPVWARGLDERLRKFMAFPANWDTYGGVPLKPEIAAIAATMLTPPAIVPTADGGIQFEWHRHQLYVEITIYGDGTMEAEWNVTPAAPSPTTGGIPNADENKGEP